MSSTPIHTRYKSMHASPQKQTPNKHSTLVVQDSPNKTFDMSQQQRAPHRLPKIRDLYGQPQNEKRVKKLNPEEIPQDDVDQSNVKLVPCRWSITGWKYVKEEPKDHKYFQSPYRMNFHGFRNDGTGQPLADNIKKASKSMNRQKRDEMNTTYSRQYSPYKLVELQNWQKQFEGKAQLQNLDEGQNGDQSNGDKYQWGGGVHFRRTFNKSKDFLSEWTNVLYRHK